MGLFYQKYACHFQPFKSEIFFSIFIDCFSICAFLLAPSLEI